MSILTDREREVLALVAQGMSNQEVADALCISDRTVRTHMLSITESLGARNRTDAVRIAQQRGEIPTDGTLSPVAFAIYHLLKIQPGAMDELRAAGIVN